jgi:hypothetical protein
MCWQALFSSLHELCWGNGMVNIDEEHAGELRQRDLK